VNSSCDDPSDRIEKKVSERGVVVISDFQFSLNALRMKKKTTMRLQKRTAFFNFGFVGSARTTIFERAFECVEDAIDETAVVVVVVVVNMFFRKVRLGAVSY
tara:strand:+ start:1614 stop:1919 length:306 start_codon:yes stop_codon:yes gene_type:complete